MKHAMTGLVAALAVVATMVQPALADAGRQKVQQPAGRSQASQDREARSERMLEDLVFVRLAEQAWAGGDFTVQARGNAITLSGTVPSDQAKRRMVRIALRTPGVTEVRDQLRVQPASASAPATTTSDRMLAQRVAQQIASKIEGAKAGEDWWLTGWRVEGPDNRWSFTVEAENGDIWLEGEVPRYRHIREAVEAARKADGVRSVRSNLEIDRHFYAYPFYGPYPGLYYPRYGYYPYPYASWDRDDYDVDVAVSDPIDAHGFRGLHAMTGEVTKIDKQKGTLSLKTAEGMLDLHFPPSALKDVDRGERITVELGLKAAEAPAASPRSDRAASPSPQSIQQR